MPQKRPVFELKGGFLGVFSAGVLADRVVGLWPASPPTATAESNRAERSVSSKSGSNCLAATSPATWACLK
jgi:hypothetical protein